MNDSGAAKGVVSYKGYTFTLLMSVCRGNIASVPYEMHTESQKMVLLQYAIKYLADANITVLLNKGIFAHVALWHESNYSCPYELYQTSRS